MLQVKNYDEGSHQGWSHSFFSSSTPLCGKGAWRMQAKLSRESSLWGRVGAYSVANSCCQNRLGVGYHTPCRRSGSDGTREAAKPVASRHVSFPCSCNWTQTLLVSSRQRTFSLVVEPQAPPAYQMIGSVGGGYALRKGMLYVNNNLATC